MADAGEASPLTAEASMALKSFEIANDIKSEDDLYRYDAASHHAQVDARPWESDVKYFKKVKISALALLRMVMHARSGGRLEVMGMMQGKINGDTMIIMDSFALPVEGTETRVNAGDAANPYMVKHVQLSEQVGRRENILGWYHSHPSYGCWLSGIDVSTQTLNQQYQDPWVAIVIDPVRTMAAGKVELGAFRCFPPNHKPEGTEHNEYQTIPLDKIEDFGVHANSYYQLEVSYFKSSLDRQLLELLWNQYWVNTLSSSPLLTSAGYTTQQIADIAAKLEQAESQVQHTSRAMGYYMPERKRDESQLSKCAKDGVTTAIESVHGLFAQTLKDMVFNRLQDPGKGATAD